MAEESGAVPKLGGLWDFISQVTSSEDAEEEEDTSPEKLIKVIDMVPGWKKECSGFNSNGWEEFTFQEHITIFLAQTCLGAFKP